MWGVDSGGIASASVKRRPRARAHHIVVHTNDELRLGLAMLLLLQMGRQSGLLAACTVILGCLGQHAQATTDASALGAYIGCFDLQKLARTDPNIATQVMCPLTDHARAFFSVKCSRQAATTSQHLLHILS